MIILSSVINFYARKVITDIGTRVGECTEANFSYGSGLESVVQKYWTGVSDSRLEYDIGAFLESYADFDADQRQPCFTEEEYSLSAVESTIVTSVYMPERDSVDFHDYYRRLEDIAPQYIERYLGNMVYNILYRNDGIMAYNKTHGVQATLSSPEEEGEYTELIDLVVYKDDINGWSMSERNEARMKLPYVLKRLHNLSMYCGVHMIEFIVSYIRAKDINEYDRSHGSTKVLKVNAVIEMGAHKYTKYGRVGDEITVASRNKKAARMFEWMEGEVNEYLSYKEDFVNFLHYMNVLNICRIDDFTKYDGLFMDKLVITTVTPNSQYDVQVFNALQANASTPVKVVTEEPLDNTIILWDQAIDTNNVIQKRLNALQSHMYEKIHMQGVAIYTMYKLFMEGVYVDSGLHWEYGYLYHNDKLAVIKTTWVNSNSIFNENNAIISELGYIVQVTSKSTLLCLDIDYAYAYVQARCKNVEFDERRMDWQRIIP